MNKIKQLLSAVILIAAIGTFSACKKTFDAPPAPGDVNIVANTTIQSLKTYHTIPGVYDLINQDVIISGIVRALFGGVGFNIRMIIFVNFKVDEAVLSSYTAFKLFLRVVNCASVTAAGGLLSFNTIINFLRVATESPDVTVNPSNNPKCDEPINVSGFKYTSN